MTTNVFEIPRPIRRRRPRAGGLRPLAAVLGALAFTAALTPGAVAAQPAPPALVSPRAPSGARAVGVTAVHLIDRSRPELATDDPADVRELMVQFWYPAAPVEHTGTAPYFLDPWEGLYNAAALGLPPELFDYVAGWARPQAPPATPRRPWPVVLFSPGLQTPVALYASVLADLASHGYVVVAMSHPYSTGVTVFPDGRAAYAPDLIARLGPEVLHRVWVEDGQFVLDWLRAAKRRNLPFVRDRLDLSRVAAAGHSFGGAAAAGLATRERQIDAVVNLDGTFWGGVAEAGLDQPLLLMTADPRTVDPTHEAFLANTRGSAYRTAVQDGGHNNFTDVGLLLPLVRTFIPDVLPEQFALGAIDALRMLDIVADYVRAFLDEAVRRRPSDLLQGPAPQYPDVRFEAFGRR